MCLGHYVLDLSNFLALFQQLTIRIVDELSDFLISDHLAQPWEKES